MINCPWSINFNLNNLNKEEVNELVLRKWRPHSILTLDPALLDVIFYKTGGNPVYMHDYFLLKFIILE